MHPRAVLLGQIVVAQRVAQERRHERQGKQDCAQQRKRQREGDRREDLALDPLESKNRHEGQDDDRLREHDRATELERGVLQRVHTPAIAAVNGIVLGSTDRELDHQRLDHHHRTVDDDAEVDRAQRDQVGADTARVHHDEGEQQRQRNHRRHRERRVPVAQEQHQDRDHQRRADREILGDGVDSVFDEVGAIVVRHDADAGRQARGHPSDLHFEVLDNLGCVLPLGHLHDRLHDFFALVERNDAGARASADFNPCEIADLDRAAVARRHHHARNVLDVREQADAADHQRLVAALQKAAAGIGAVVRQRLPELVDGDCVFAQQKRIDPDLVFLDEAAKAHHVGDAGRAAQRGLQRPVLQRAHFGERHVGRRDDHIPIDFTDRVGEGRQRRLQVGRQVDVLQPLEHLLAREVIVGAVRKRQRHDRQPRDRHGTQLRHARHAAHLAFDRQRYRALDFLRRLARDLRDDLDLHVLHVGKSFDRQVAPCVPARNRERQRQRQHEHALLQRKRDEPVVKHC